MKPFQRLSGENTLINTIKALRKNRAEAKYGAFSFNNSPVVINKQTFKPHKYEMNTHH